jgi:hypothetical protein
MRRWSPLILVLALLAFGACALLRSQPKISLEQQAQWLQTRAELAEAKLSVTAAEAKLAQIVANMQATCPLVLKDGRPECAPKPEAKKQ